VSGTNRLRRSLDRQQVAPPGEYFRYKQREGVVDDDVMAGKPTSRLRSRARGGSVVTDLLKRNWEDIAMSAWG